MYSHLNFYQIKSAKRFERFHNIFSFAPLIHICITGSLMRKTIPNVEISVEMPHSATRYMSNKWELFRTMTNTSCNPMFLLLTHGIIKQWKLTKQQLWWWGPQRSPAPPRLTRDAAKGAECRVQLNTQHKPEIGCEVWPFGRRTLGELIKDVELWLGLNNIFLPVRFVTNDIPEHFYTWSDSFYRISFSPTVRPTAA